MGAPDLPVDPALAVETDGSFAALLCALPVCYAEGALPSRVETAGEARSGGLFARTLAVEAVQALATRVEARLEQLAPGLVARLHRAVLSEADGAALDALRLAVCVAARGASAADDWRFGPAYRVARLAQRVSRERHRMEAFVRFERHAAGDGGEIYVATVSPEHHVLPLLTAHFADRYPAMRWAIVDARRGLALVHPTPATERAADAPPTQIVPAAAVARPDEAPDEAAFQAMWQAYVRAVDIPERKNLALHQRHVPRRYWPFLTEKRASSVARSAASAAGASRIRAPYHENASPSASTAGAPNAASASATCRSANG